MYPASLSSTKRQERFFEDLSLRGNTFIPCGLRFYANRFSEILKNQGFQNTFA